MSGHDNKPEQPVKSRKLAKLIRLKRTVANWPRTMLDHLRLPKADYICHLRNGLSFEVRGGTDDRHVIFEVFVENIYPIGEAQLAAGSVIVDIGAQIGCFTVRAARRGARVFSFEPFPANFAALQRNVQLNGVANASLFQTAVSGQRGNSKMFLPSNEAHSGRYSLYPGRGEQTIDVTCITLDDVLHENNLERIYLLKIDCQGAEYEILYEASAEMLRRIQTIIVECEVFEEAGNRSIEGMTKYLEKSGFTVKTQENLLHASR